MKKHFCLILFFITFLSYGQKLSFRYNDTPLVEIINDLEDRFDLRFSYKSDLLGKEVFTYNGEADLKTFLNSISEEKSLEFIFIGDENVVIKSSFDLTYDSNKLNEVVLVTEYLTSGFDQNKKDGSITMKPTKLGVLPGLTEPDVLQSLQLLPGITSPTESASNLHIRGGTPDQNLILYDGIKIYHQGHLFGMISPFNPYVVESVNVSRSGTKPEFGDRIAGVVDINSLTEVPTETSGGFGANFLHGDVYVKTPIKSDKIGFLFSARRSINDIFNLPTFNSFSDKVFQNTKIEETNDVIEEEELEVLRDKFNFLDINAKLVFQPNEKNKISVSSLLVDNSLDYANVDAEDFGTRDKLNLNNKGLSAQWDYQSKRPWNYRSSFSYSEFNSDYQFTQLTPFGSLNTATNSNKVQDFGLQLQARKRINTKGNLKFGYELINYLVGYKLAFNNDAITIEDVRTNLSIHNVYAESEYQFDKFFLRGGFRTSYYPQIKEFFVEPRIYSHYNVTDHFKLKASMEIKNQGISQLVSFGFNDLGVGEAVWVLADQEQGVPVLNNRQMTFGFFFDKDGWKIDVESYHKKVKGLTTLTSSFATNPFSEIYASGNSSIFGIDVLLKKKINRFRTWLGYSYSKNDFNFPDLQTGRFPGNFDQRHVISFTNSFKYNQFQFSLGWQFASGRPYSEGTLVNGEVVFQAQNTQRLLSYHKMDLSAFYDFYFDSKSKIKARLGASIINLYNRDNEINTTFGTTTGNGGNVVLSELTSVGLGITPNVVFRVYF